MTISLRAVVPNRHDNVGSHSAIVIRLLTAIRLFHCAIASRHSAGCAGATLRFGPRAAALLVAIDATAREMEGS